MEIMGVSVELLAAFLSGVVGPILYLLIDKYISKQKDKKKDKLKDSVEDNCTINEQLEDILEEFKADRIWIAQFHNGGNFYPTGKSIQKFSVFHELTVPGVASISHLFNNIPCSLYPRAFQQMIENGSIFIPDYNDPTIATYGLKGAGEATGSKSTYQLPMFTFDNRYIGVLGIDYVTKKKRLTKDQWEHLQIRVSKVGGYLAAYLQKK